METTRVFQLAPGTKRAYFRRVQPTVQSRPYEADESLDREAKRWRQFKFFALLPVSVGIIVSYTVLFVVMAIHHLAPQTDALMANAQKIALIASLGSAVIVGLIGTGLVAKGLSMPSDGSDRKR